MLVLALLSGAPGLAFAHTAQAPLASCNTGQLCLRIQQLVPNTYNQLLVYVNVIGKNGQPVIGLAPSDVTATVDGQPMQLQDLTEVTDISTPITAAVLLDTSGSMGSGNKLPAAKAAIKSFVQSLSNQDQVALYQVAGNGPGGVKKILNFTTDHNRLSSAIDPLQAAGNTPIYDALYQVAHDMASVQGRKLAILQTDGVDDSSQHSLDEALRLAEQVHLPVYTIGLGADADVNTLERIAQNTGGTFFYDPQPTSLQNSYQTILSQLRDTYRMTLQSPTSFSVGSHVVQVQVNYQGRPYTDSATFQIAATNLSLHFSLPPGAHVSGATSLSLDVQGDDLPISSVSVTINGNPFATLHGGGPHYQLPTWNTRYLLPGAYKFHITATDIEGNRASLDLTVQVGIEWPYWIGLLIQLLLLLAALVVLRYAYYRFMGGKLEGILTVRNAADQKAEVELGHDVKGSRMRLKITESGIVIGAHPPWKKIRFEGPAKPIPETAKITKKGKKVRIKLYVRKERMEAGARRIPVPYYFQKGKKKPSELKNGMSKRAGNYRVDFTD
jgi:VWFA-related protein